MNTFPRVSIPGVEVHPEIREALDAAQAHRNFLRRQQKGMALAMTRLGKPIFRAGKPKRRKPSANLTYRATMRARSAYLKGAAQ